MAFEPISIVVEMVDKITEPAKEAGGELEHLAKHAGGIEGLAKSLGRLISPAVQGRNELGQLTAAVGPLDEVMPGVTKGFEFATVAVVGLAVAMTTATVGLAAFALEASEAREKSEAMLGALLGSRDAGDRMSEAIDDLRGKLGLTRAELVPMTQQLLAMGVKAGDVEEQLTALASVKSLGDPAGTEAYLNLLRKVEAGVKIGGKSLANLSRIGLDNDAVAKRMGVSTGQLAKGFGAGSASAKRFLDIVRQMATEKGAESLAVQADNLGVRWNIFKENFSSALGSVFDNGTEGGKAMSELFDKALGAAANAIPTIRHYFVQALIVVLKFVEWVGKTYTFFTKTAVGAHLLKGALIAVGIVLGAIALAFGVVAIVLALVLVPVALLASALTVVWVAGSRVVGFVKGLIPHLASLGIGAKNAGANLISGLIVGITSGVDGAVNAVKGLGKKVLSGLKGVLGIASPSKEMMRIGLYSGAGFAEGIEASSEQAASSGSQMAARAGDGAEGGGTGGSVPAGGRTVTVTLMPGAISIDGAGKSALELTDAMIVAAFERIGLQAGLA